MPFLPWFQISLPKSVPQHAVGVQPGIVSLCCAPGFGQFVSGGASGQILLRDIDNLASFSAPWSSSTTLRSPVNAVAIVGEKLVAVAGQKADVLDFEARTLLLKINPVGKFASHELSSVLPLPGKELFILEVSYITWPFSTIPHIFYLNLIGGWCRFCVM